MASDNIRQVGKYVRQTRKDTDHALTRYHSKIPVIERTRDIFDSEIPFKMNFKTERKESKVLLDLNFNKPPPLMRCKSDCLASACESFVVEPGDHLITLSQPYMRGTTTVFLNYSQVLPSSYEETNPDSGQIFVQGTTTSTLITVCYSYGNCDEDFEDCVNVGTGAYTGLAVVFMDRFDRTTPIENPAGGCGTWEPGGFPLPPIVDGTAAMHNAQATLLEPLAAQAEALFLVKGFGISGSWGVSMCGSSVTYNPVTQILTMQSTYRYFRDDSDLSSLQGGTVTRTFPNTHTASDFYVRFAIVPGSGAYVRIWSYDEPEPAGGLFGIWTSSIGGGSAPDVPGYTLDGQVFSALDVVGTTFNFNTALKAINIWGQPGEASYNMAASPFPGGYRISTCYPNPDGLLRQGHCNPLYQTIEPISATQQMDNSQPRCQATLSYEIAIGHPRVGPGYLQSSAQQSRSFQDLTNAASQIRVTGQVQVNNFMDVPLDVTFYQLANWPSEPGTGFDEFVGTPVGSAGGGTGGWNGSWSDFDITLDVGEDGIVNWTVGFAGGMSAVEGALGGFLEEADSNEHCTVALRYLKIYSISPLSCSTVPYCPDSIERYNERNQIEEEL